MARSYSTTAPSGIAAPGGESGGLRISEPVSSIDVGATLLDLVGLLSLQPEERFGRGVSLVRLISADGRGQPARVLMAELVQGNATSTMVQLWPYRLIDMVGAEGAELYRIDRDPGERWDISAEEATMMARLERLRRVPEREAADERRPGVEVPQDGELRRQLDALGYIDPYGDV
jgi:arylsulfatase A-like enzyme